MTVSFISLINFPYYRFIQKVSHIKAMLKAPCDSEKLAKENLQSQQVAPFEQRTFAIHVSVTQ